MCQNYERRVKDFIIEMSNPDTRIKIRDLTDKILNPKVDLLEDKEIQKPFIFKGYTSELDRIKDTVNNNRYLYNLPDYDEVVKKVHSVKKSPKVIKKRDLSVSLEKKHDFIMQPQMRFKPRTDLERVYDTLNGYHYSENEKQIIERQLKKINLYDYKKTPFGLYKSNAISTRNNNKNNKIVKNNKLIEEKENILKNNKSLNSKLYYSPMRTAENSKPWERKTDLNNEACNILKSYHQKIHFKAAKEIACNTINNQKKTVGGNNKISCFLLPNLNHRNYLLKENNTYKEPDLSDLENEINDINFNDDKETNNEVEYKNNINPLNIKEKISPTKETMSYLEKMAFENTIGTKDKEDEGDLIKINTNPTTDDDNIVIGNEVFNKKKQFGAITNKVLGNCNVWKRKSMFNDTFLKKGNGKTMITQGMTVMDFENKYNLKE